MWFLKNKTKNTIIKTILKKINKNLGYCLIHKTKIKYIQTGFNYSHLHSKNILYLSINILSIKYVYTEDGFIVKIALYFLYFWWWIR